MSRTPQQALATIPGWQDASWSRLSGGLTNSTYRIELGERRAVLKIDESPRDAPFATRHAEAQVQRIAAESGLANRVLYVDETTYLTEYVEGVVWTRDCLDTQGNLVLIATALKRLHALPLTGRSFDAGIAAKRYVQESCSVRKDIEEICTRTVARMRLPLNLCCCHNDLVAENLITIPELRFLDWEYACDNDPFFDLATVVEHHQLSERQVGALLDTYFDGDGLRWRDYLLRQQRLYLALLWLWMAARPDSDQQELDRVGERVITNCS